MNNLKISLLIPCHNEEKGIEKILKNAPDSLDEKIVIDNNSTDNTAAIAKKFGAKVIFEKKKGYGRCYKKGLQNISGDIIVCMDGDNQYPIQELSRLIEILIRQDLDFISCSRFPLSSKKSMPFLKRIGNKILTSLANLLFKTNLKDSQSGMWIFRKSILSKIKLENNGMPFSEEIKIKVALHPEVKFKEMHINYNLRIGKSKISILKDGLENLLYLFKLCFSK